MAVMPSLILRSTFASSPFQVRFKSVPGPFQIRFKSHRSPFYERAIDGSYSGG